MSSTTMSSLQDEIMLTMSQELNLEVLSADRDLIASGVIDSLALVELILQLEHRYGVEIMLDELDLDVFRTVTGIAMFIEQLRNDPGTLIAEAAPAG